MDLSPLTTNQILAWVDAHKEATKEWPNVKSGQVTGTDETWMGIGYALRHGKRSLAGHTSLAMLLAEHRGLRNAKALLPLSIEQILTWADAHKATTGEWPSRNSGVVTGTDETWLRIDDSLKQGNRSLACRSWLAKLLDEHRGVRNIRDLFPLTIEQILAWADSHNSATRSWPKQNSGLVTDTDETWGGINAALYSGNRSLPGGSSLAKLLAEHRSIRNKQDLPPLTIEQILTWADAHNKANGNWPTRSSGRVIGTEETWANIDGSLQSGVRGLPGGSSLPKLLAEHRGARNSKDLPPLSIEQILEWADTYHAATDDWPNVKSGPVTGTEETWVGIETALSRGRRGLRGRSTLAKLLSAHRGVRNIKALSPLTIN